MVCDDNLFRTCFFFISRYTFPHLKLVKAFAIPASMKNKNNKLGMIRGNTECSETSSLCELVIPALLQSKRSFQRV